MYGSLHRRGVSVAILQANLNHACQSRDLFLHTLAERSCGLDIVAEPYCLLMGESKLVYR